MPFVEGVTFVVPPWQMSRVPPKTGAPGITFIATLTEEGDAQLLALITVNVYDVLAGSPVTV
jgi:hypothetical protein